MPFQPEKIKRSHVLKAFQEIDAEKVDIRPSTKWDIVYNGKRYPPKDVGRLAHEYATGEYFWQPGGGEDTNKYFKKLGFLIVNKTKPLDDVVKALIPSYKHIITTHDKYDEIYKWEAVGNFQNHWDLDADDLVPMIDKSFPGNNNLWTSRNYYPINMLKTFAENNAPKVRTALQNLFDENSPLDERISAYQNVLDELLREDNVIRSASNKHHYHDARSISLLLSFQAPTKYFLFKHGVLKKFCARLEIDMPKTGDIVNQILINNEVNLLVKEILVQDKELLELHKNRLTPNSFESDDNNILTQDFIYSIVNYMDKDNVPAYYCVGFTFDDSEPKNQLPRFLEEDLWENGYSDKNIEIVKEVPIGSMIAAKTTYTEGDGSKTLSVLKIHAIGKVIENPKDGNFLSVKWEKNLKPFVLYGKGGYRSTISQVRNQESIDLIFNLKKDLLPNKSEIMRDIEISLNQILYGPPGTGKTYKTKDLAVQIANPRFEVDDDLGEVEKRYVITKEYNRLYNNGQIVFTTFHQSFSYEDFVEGIKPETLDNNVTYSVVPGIFKEICEKADTKDASNFEEILTQFKADVIEKEKITINTGSIEFDVFYKGGKTFKINPKDSKIENPQYPASIENILQLYKGASIQNIYNPSYVRGILNYLFAEYGLKKYDSIGVQNNKNYVLIIDEINRGNVSAIFGELITLLEPDKRLAADEEITVKLPYSKDETFGVPPNLYIIGTMNTADRSVEALDTALRRRFVFKEVMPDPTLLAAITFNGFNLEQVLITINDRIEVLLDRDHTIGHSYFIKLESNDTEGLLNVFNNNIIPLLQEYFYNDYEKIALVLGKGFIEEKVTKKVEFAKFSKIEEPETGVIYNLITTIDDIEKAVSLLLGISNE
ncbi:AAA family ATPase [Arenibacter sp. F20364]|uniref:McrB family protein n=1 Tax=Arenibacter sp. F20364 TaxID=2926415 RepID=UPI001FF4E607|nr:AAA family ATPase [Arenibacter sp. F20364]MCK0190449.1 AAA family ATPase [Arenibacter sp. F20364]